MALLAKNVPDLIISGGQTGADYGALLGARALGIATGGVAPKGYKTERGPHPELGSVFGLVESASERYDVRTGENVAMADAIILIAHDFTSAGTKLTKSIAMGYWRPVFEVAYSYTPWIGKETLMDDIRSWLDWHRPSTLMIAGNRESKAKGIEKMTQQFITKLFTLTAEKESETLILV